MREMDAGCTKGGQRRTLKSVDWVVRYSRWRWYVRTVLLSSRRQGTRNTKSANSEGGRATEAGLSRGEEELRTHTSPEEGAEPLRPNGGVLAPLPSSVSIGVVEGPADVPLSLRPNWAR